MAEKSVVTNAPATKSKYTFLLHLLTGCLIFYGLMVNTNPPIQQNANMDNTQSFFTETVDFHEAEIFSNTDITIEKNQFFDFDIPAPYMGRNVEKHQHITTRN